MNDIMAVLIAGIVTFLIRAIPFILFGGKQQMPVFVKEIAEKLPPMIIAILVIYCIKDVSFQDMTKVYATLVGVLSVIGLHLWRRNILLSIAGSTLIYMFILRCL